MLNKRTAWASLCGLFLWALTWQAAQAQGMSLADIAKLEQVGQIAISPDGSSIAYTRIVPRELGVDPDGRAYSELHVLDAEGQSRAFISGQVNVGGLGWADDGETITFLARREGDEHTRLYGIPLSGGEARVLAKPDGAIRSYSFSPDHQQVALVVAPPESKERQAEKDKGFSQIIFEEEWRANQLWIQTIDGESEMVTVDGSVQQVQWSPTGDRLAISVTPRQLIDDTLMFQRIRIIALDGREIGRVNNPGKLGAMAWSPSGHTLAFIGTTVVRDPREGRLMVAPADGGDWTELMPGLLGHVWHMAWHDDEIVFVSYEGVETRLGQISPNGENEQTLAQWPDVVLEGLSVGDHGAIALSASTPTHPREVFRWRAEDASAERLTDSNPWLAEKDMARQTVVRYEASDGLDLEGLLIWPQDYQEGRRYPLILAVHGGPEAHYSNGWISSYALPGQVAASEGYFMFYPNYRGSTGRGVDFTLSSQGRPAAEEFSDLIDGVDHLINIGLVDSDRVGITGGSYGGYATAWGATYYTDRFAAAVMNVGLSDKIAMLGTSDIAQELYLVHYLTWPWEDWDLYRKASPIYYADQAKTPILIMHGAADPRVDPTQSRILYRYLVLQDDPPPVRLVLYPGEGHGNQRAASRWDYSLRLMRWMDHYLKGEGGEMPPYALDYGLDAETDNGK
ncbi:MAG TPA: S9 family peptidase [Wenzhouxiangella sp.]